MDLSNHRYIIFFPFLFVSLSLSITNCRYTSSLQVCAACNLFFRPFVVDFCRSLSEDHFSLFFISPHSVEFYFLWWSLPFVPLFSQHHLPIGTHGQPHTFSSLSPFFPSPPLSLSLFLLSFTLFLLSLSLFYSLLAPALQRRVRSHDILLRAADSLSRKHLSTPFASQILSARHSYCPKDTEIA